MKIADVEKLKVGDRVRHTDGTAGTVTDAFSRAFAATSKSLF